jgi:hypothetical protein
MPSCERCWSEASARAVGTHRPTIDVYYEVVKEREDAGLICTPQEQAGQWWDEEKQRDSRIPEDQK